MSNEKLLKEIEDMVRLLPLSTLPGFHLNTKGMINESSVFNILDNETMMIQKQLDNNTMMIQGKNKRENDGNI